VDWPSSDSALQALICGNDLGGSAMEDNVEDIPMIYLLYVLLAIAAIVAVAAVLITRLIWLF
jgi:hypothetical protein